MGRPSKFTQERRDKILEVLRLGGSKHTAADYARVDRSQISRWLARGKEAEEGSSFRQFYEDVIEAEAQPRVRALWSVNKAMSDNPTLAFKFLERREPGFAPPMPSAPAAAAVVAVHLSFADGSPAEPTWMDVIDAPQVPALSGPGGSGEAGPSDADPAP